MSGLLNADQVRRLIAGRDRGGNQFRDGRIDQAAMAWESAVPPRAAGQQGRATGSQQDLGNGERAFNLGLAQLRADRPHEALRSYKQCLDLGYAVPETHYNIACCHARLGEIDSAFSYLGKAVDFGFLDAEATNKDPDLAPLRNDPRFAAVLDRMRSLERRAAPPFARPPR